MTNSKKESKTRQKFYFGMEPKKKPTLSIKLFRVKID